MALTATNVQTLARLTQIRQDNNSLDNLAGDLSMLASLADNLVDIDTGDTHPLISPLDMTQRLRPDAVSEENRRDLYQSIAPATESGLYLVPKVLD